MRDKVLCLIKTVEEEDEQELWMDIKSTKKEIILPLYNHPHNDKENGQEEIHYHQNNKYKGDSPMLFKSFNGRVDLPLKDGEYLSFRFLHKINDFENSSTPIGFISKSKLKHKCIHKGKCPHRGFDLSGEIADEKGIITCPLHGLQFDSKSKKIITKLF